MRPVLTHDAGDRFRHRSWIAADRDGEKHPSAASPRW
jgi:hypothetical protein